MRGFCVRVGLFLLLQAALFWGLLWNPELPGEDNYLAATIEKHQRLQEVRGPKIILVGGSNVAFGFDSDRLTGELKMPVVNMGLVGGLGMEFMLNEVEGAIRPGDMVILSFEYDLLGGGGSELVFRQLLALRPASSCYVPVWAWKELVTESGFSLLGGIVRGALPASPATGLMGEQENGYQRRQFDVAGGYVGHHGSSLNLRQVAPDRVWLGTMSIRPMSDSVFQRLEDFARKCARIGAKCYYTCPPHPLELLESRRELIEANWRRLLEVEHLTVLDRPTEQAYPVTAFYDTGYHLTKDGSVSRTEKVARKIKSKATSGWNRLD